MGPGEALASCDIPTDQGLGLIGLDQYGCQSGMGHESFL
jgi:hypothetical protein